MSLPPNSLAHISIIWAFSSITSGSWWHPRKIQVFPWCPPIASHIQISPFIQIRLFKIGLLKPGTKYCSNIKSIQPKPSSSYLPIYLSSSVILYHVTLVKRVYQHEIRSAVLLSLHSQILDFSVYFIMSFMLILYHSIFNKLKIRSKELTRFIFNFFLKHT